MQKKLLACLLVTPVATAAVANTAVPNFPTEASTDATQDGYQLDFGEGGSGLVAPVGIYTVKFAKINLYPGTYELNLGTAENVLVRVDGADVTVDADGKATFEISDKKDVEITLNAADREVAFSCTKAELTVVINEQELHDALAAALADAEPLALTVDTTDQTPKALKDKYTSLKNRYDAIANDIAKIVEPVAIDDYGKFELWKGEKDCTIAVAIAALKADVDAYNAEAKTENEAVTDRNSNKATWDRWANQVKAYENKVKPYAEETDEFIKARTSEALAVVNGMIAKLNAELEAKKNFAEPFVTPEGCGYNEVMAAFATLEADKNTAVADKAAYEAYVAALKQFTESYNGVLNALNVPTDVDEKEGDAFLTTRRKATADVTAIYEANFEKLADKLTAADAENADINKDALDAKVANLAAKTTDMTGIQTTFENLVKADNAAYNDYQKTLNGPDPQGLKDKYKEAQSAKVPTGQDAKYKELTKAVDDAFAALDAFVTAHYGTDLSTTENQTEYAELVKAVEDAISALKLNTDNYDQWNQFQKALDDNNDAIKTLSEKLKTDVEKDTNKEVTIDLYSNFKPTIDNIQAAIDQLKPGDPTDEIEEAIKNVKTTAENFDKAFRDAVAGYADFSGELSAYKKFIDDKFVFSKDGKPVYGKDNEQTKYDDLAKTLGEFKDKLNAVDKADTQKSYEQAVALAKEIADSSFKTDLGNAKKDFAYNASVANKKYVEDVYAASEANYNKQVEAGVPDIDVANLAALTAEKDAAVALVTETASPEDLTDADKALKAVADNCKIFDDNVNAYVELYNTVKDVPSEIETALKFEDPLYTIDPAKAYFTGVLNDYRKAYDTFMEDIKAALTDKKVVEGKPDKGEVKGFTTRAAELTADVKNVKERIHKNQQVYDALLDESKNTLAVINNVYKFIETNIANDNDEYENYKSQLDALADELTGVNLDMTGDFGKGLLDDVKRKEYSIKYEDIVKRAQNLQGDIDKAVSGLNDATAAGWDSSIEHARTVKDAAVRVYNDYYWDIDNKGYRAFVDETLTSYRDLYDFTKTISDLDARFEAWKAEQNENRVVFSKADYETWTAEIATIEKQINDREKELVDDMNRLGGEYWTQEYTNRAMPVYSGMMSALTGAGMATVDETGAHLSADLAGTPQGKVFEDAIAALPAAEDGHDNAVAAGTEDISKYDKQIGYAMDAIADQLDKIAYTADQLEAAAKVHLDALYDDFTETATDAKEEARKVDFVTEERIGQAVADIEAQETAAAEANDNFGENAFDSLTQSQGDPFKEYADEITKILNDLNAESDAKEASKKLYDDYTLDDGNGIIPSLNNDLDALRTYAASMAAYSRAETTSAIAAAEAAVKTLAEFVEENQAILSEPECSTWAETLKGEADKAIEKGYADVRTAETSVLAGLIKDVRVAFDNAKAETEWAQVNAAVYEKKINAAIAAFDALSDNEPETNEEFQTAAIQLEKDLCTYLSDLEEVYNHDGTSADIAKANLDKTYTEVKGNIETADDMEGFEDEVKSKYEPEYKALADKLDNIRSRYTADASVVVREANYLAEINAVQAELDALNAEAAQADQDAKYQKEVAANASALSAELAGYQTRYDALLAYTQAHGLYEENTENYYSNWLTTVAQAIAADTQWLADSQAEGTKQPLTPESVLPNGSTIDMILDYVDYYAHNEVVNNTYNDAFTALQDASAALADAHLVPADRAKLESDYNTASLNKDIAFRDYKDAWNKINAGGSVNLELLEEFVEAANKAEEAFNAVKTAAKAVTAGVADLHFVPGDVEDDRKVTAVDVQQVINWIGQSVTYDDLLASNARQAYAADVNEDSKINIADVVAISNIVLNDLNNPTMAPRMLVKGVQQLAENNLTVALGETVDGVREYAVMINNTTAFVGGQLDINVGAGMEIVDIELTERGADHKLYRFDNNSGARVIIASMANDELRGNSGAMLIVRTRGAGNLTVGNAVFSDINATAYGLAGEGMSAIDSIGESFRNVKERIYNVAGQALDRLQRGVNIIRKSDGSTTKEMH